MKTPLLETERLILRPISLDDAPALQKHFDNWNIIQNLSTRVPWPYPEDGVETYFKEELIPQIEIGNLHAWVLIEKTGGGDVIGLIDFRLEAKQECGNRGFWLAEEFQRRGFMTEAISAVNDFIFFNLKLEKFTVTNVKSNIASRRVKEKTGAQFIGIQESFHHNGEKESEVWEVTRENWRKIRGELID